RDTYPRVAQAGAARGGYRGRRGCEKCGSVSDSTFRAPEVTARGIPARIRAVCAAPDSRRGRVAGGGHRATRSPAFVGGFFPQDRCPSRLTTPPHPSPVVQVTRPKWTFPMDRS